MDALQKFVGALVLLVLLVFAYLFGDFNNRALECRCKSHSSATSKDEVSVQVRVLKSEKEIIFFHPLPRWENDEKANAKIIDRVNEEAERWQKDNPKKRVADIKIEEKDYPRIYSISLSFEPPQPL